MEILITTLDTIGKLFIGWAALSVHHKVMQEHQIDKKVFRLMRIEQKLGFMGIAFIVIAYFIKVGLS